MSSNGQLSSADLAPIWNGMRLQKDAARSFNAMDAEAVERFGRHIGVNDAYRILGARGDYHAGRWSQWAAWERHLAGGNLAAFPGTSNHGLGLAVDLSPDGIMIVNAIGSKYGWAKRWSDAPSENWHFKYRSGVWSGKLTTTQRLALDPLNLNDKSDIVRSVQIYLRRGHYLPRDFAIPRNIGTYGPKTVDAVKRFQHHLKINADGVVGPKTFAALRRRYSLDPRHRRRKGN